jgi:hypothetical protein
MSDQPDAENSTWQNAVVTIDESKLPVGIEPASRSSEGPQIHALDSAVIGINSEDYTEKNSGSWMV